MFLATSINIKQVFSKGWILLSHLHSKLSVQSTCALMCVGERSSMGFIKDHNIRAATALLKVNSEEKELEDDWDTITSIMDK